MAKYYVAAESGGGFKLIDGALLHLYGNPENLVEISAEQRDEVLARAADNPRWDGGKFVFQAATLSPAQSAAELLAAAVAAGTERINSAVEAVLQPLTRFEVEYKRREAQARAYRDAGYKGEVPLQVTAFAKPAGKTPKEAADIIIAQADMLYSLLDKLGELRMRKFELGSLKTAAEVKTRTAEIVAQIESAAAQLAA